MIFSSSGAHINPSVTVAEACIGYFPWRKVPVYILAQYAGSFAASICVYLVYFGKWKSDYLKSNIYNLNIFRLCRCGDNLHDFHADFMHINHFCKQVFFMKRISLFGKQTVFKG